MYQGVLRSTAVHIVDAPMGTTQYLLILDPPPMSMYVLFMFSSEEITGIGFKVESPVRGVPGDSAFVVCPTAAVIAMLREDLMQSSPMAAGRTGRHAARSECPPAAGQTQE